MWAEYLASTYGLTLFDFAVGGASANDLTKYGKPFLNPSLELEMYEKAMASGAVKALQPSVAVIEFGANGANLPRWMGVTGLGGLGACYR